MKIIDISREMFSTPAYPGDPKPYRDIVRRIDMGDEYNLSGFYACCHSATHMDAPLHFIDGGGSIDSIDLKRCFGPCSIIEATGIVTGADIDKISAFAKKRVIFKGGGKAFLSPSAAFALADSGTLLAGTDAQSIGTADYDAAAHKELLRAGIPILEGLYLDGVTAGDYILAAFPLKLGGAEASPLRAVLLGQ